MFRISNTKSFVRKDRLKSNDDEIRSAFDQVRQYALSELHTHYLAFGNTLDNHSVVSSSAGYAAIVEALSGPKAVRHSAAVMRDSFDNIKLIEILSNNFKYIVLVVLSMLL